MEPDQVHVLAAPVFRGCEQIVHAREARFAGELVGDVRHLDRLDRVDDNVPLIHRIAAADLDVRTQPDANAATDASAANPFPKLPGEYHRARAYAMNEPPGCGDG